MEKKFSIESVIKKTDFSLEDSKLKISGSFIQDADGKLKSISGAVRNADDSMAGIFSGRVSENGLVYDYSQTASNGIEDIVSSVKFIEEKVLSIVAEQ